MQKILAFNRTSTAESRFHLKQDIQNLDKKWWIFLVDGGKKYNKSKRKNTKENRRKRKKKRVKGANTNKKKNSQNIENDYHIHLLFIIGESTNTGRAKNFNTRKISYS